MIYQAVTIPLEEQLQIIASANGFAIITNLGSYTAQLVGLFLIVATLAAFGFLVWAGIQWITAGADKNKLEEAKSRLTNAIVGLTIVAASWAVFLVLNYFFGLGLAEGTPGGGNNTGGGCSMSSAANCQGRSPGASCGNDGAVCTPLNNQPPGGDGLVRCTCG